MDTSRYHHNTFYDRTIDTFINNLSNFSSNELKLLLVIAKLTLKDQTLIQIPIKIDELMVVCSTSKKTIIKSIKQIVKKGYLCVNKTVSPHAYFLNRSTIFELSVVETKSEKIFESVAFTQSLVEKMHFERCNFPPSIEKAIHHWNRYVHFPIDLNNHIHVMCLKHALNTYSTTQLINDMKQFVYYRANKALINDESMLQIFEVQREVSNDRFN